MRKPPSLAIALTVTTTAILSGLLTADPAYASCAASVPASPYQFTGTVLSTSRGGRGARVRTADGRIVEVTGSPGTGSERTTVDRTYQIGIRYEFDPFNSASPFRDNACSATHPLPPGEVRASDATVAAAPVAAGRNSDAWSGLALALAGGAAALAGLGGFGLVRRTRRGRLG